MSWYDRYKEAKILVIQDTNAKGVSRNAFWQGYYDPKTNQVHLKWGRIGTKGQSKSKDFGSEGSAINFIDKKYREKRNKGYTSQHEGSPIDSAMLDQLHIEAQIVGASNKMIDMQWMECTGDHQFSEINVERLYDPECNPAIRVKLETRKSYADQNVFTLLFGGDGSYIVSGPRGGILTPISSTHPLHKMVEKVEEALGRKLSGAE